MIPQIEEIDFPKIDGKQYATLSSATVTLQDMGEKNITAQVKIDGDIAPNFSRDWVVKFRGEKYIMPLRKPQAAKENTSLNSTVDLTFQHWAQYQLKRYYFFTVDAVQTDTFIPDKYIAGVSLNLKNFCILLGKVLSYYYGDTITVDLDSEWESKDSGEAVNIEINNSYIWDVLLKLYELYAVRWKIVAGDDADHYIIKIGVTEPEVSQILEYGFEGGLLKVERQVQSADIRNKLLGRGGSKNLPLRYFKDVDPANPSFPADPDWIPELRNVVFSELRSKEFRDYVKGWKTNPHRQLTEADGSPIIPFGQIDPIEVEEGDAELASTNWAYRKGGTDVRFDPPEYVKDDESIARYGELMGGLENNEDIYPTIQGRSIAGLGRIDEVVAVEQVTEDTVITEAAASDAVTVNVAPTDGKGAATVTKSAAELTSNPIVTVTVNGGQFMIPEETKGNFVVDNVAVSVVWNNGGSVFYVENVLGESYYELTGYTVKVYDSLNKEISSPSGIPGGLYTYKIVATVRMKPNSSGNFVGNYSVTVGHAGGKLTYATISKQRDGRTFDIWVKNIWNTIKRPYETGEQYAKRVWTPILGDREGNEAKVIFSDGWLSIGGDYEFKIVEGGVAYDPSESIDVDGVSVPSHWRLTLERSDADLESTGLYIPSSTVNGAAGDHFFFTGIELPHYYVPWAEEELQNCKLGELEKVSEIAPTWVVTPDRVRFNMLSGDEAETLLQRLTPGSPVRLADKRFILNDNGEPAAYETLYLQSMTLTFREPTSGDAALNPDVEIVLSNDYAVTASPVATLQGSIEALSRRVGNLGNIEQIIRAVGDKLYLRKDGIADRSVSPTEFANLLTSYGFRQGMVGGTGWGFYRDANGNWVLETDRLKARQDFEVNNLVVSQISARGGMIVESAAALEITAVEELESGNYRCYFDQKGGSIKNLFVVDDVALSHRFDPGTNQPPTSAGPSSAYEKFYKRRVMAVGESYVDLKGIAKATLPAEATMAAAAPPIQFDTGINGSGIPAAGDTIVQYGNYTDATRRYVIVRDVVGGGYERFIEGLDSVNSAGTEYYFVGKQHGMYGNKARFFLGNTQNFIEFVEGVLHIKADLSVESTIDGMSVAEYIESTVGDEIENYALGTGMEAVFMPHHNYANETMTLYKVTGLNIGDTVKISFDYDVVDVFPLTLLWVILGREYGYRPVLKFTANGSGHFESDPFELGEGAAWDYIKDTTADTVSEIYIRADQATGGEVRISNLMFVKGDEMPDKWRPSPRDFNFMAKALGGNTSISGGLVLTSAVEVGEWGQSGFTVGAGMSGISNPQHAQGGVVFWGGGTYDQASAGQSTYVIYRDGTGHTSGGTIKFLKDYLQVGDYVNLTRDGLDMTVGNVQKMRLGNFSATTRKDTIMYDTVDTALGVLDWPAMSVRYEVTDANTLRTKVEVFPSKNPSKDIGVVLAGTKVTIARTDGNSYRAVSLYSGYGTPPDDMKVSSGSKIMLRVAFISGSNTVYREDIAPEPKLDNNGNLTYDLSSVEWVPNQKYDKVKVVFSFFNSGGDAVTGGTVTAGIQPSSNNELKIVRDFAEETVTELGNDGARFSWGNSNLFQCEGFWGVRVGGYGIQVTPTGINILKPGTGWKPL